MYIYVSADPLGVWGSEYDSFRAMRKRSDSKAKRFESDDSKFGSEAKWDIPGTPRIPQGAPRAPSGSPNDPPGTPRDLPGTPKDPPGTPKDAPGTLQDPPGTALHGRGRGRDGKRKGPCRRHRPSGLYIYIYIYILGSSARFVRKEVYGIISWDYLTGLYYGMISWDSITGIILRDCIMG